MKKLEIGLSAGLWAGLAIMMLLPLYMNSNFFFPFIFSKALVFRVTIEIMLVLWLLLVAISKKYSFKFDIISVVFLTYLAVMYLSSLLGGDFYFSFWSYIERSEGLLFWTHLVILFLVVRNFLITEKHWHIILELFFLAAQIVAVVGLLQYFKVDFINSPGLAEERVAATIGNAAFLAGYLLFAVFVGGWLAVRGRWLVYRIYIAVAVVVDIFVMLQTGTRGAFLGLLFALVLFALYNIFTSGSKKVKYISLILVALILASGLFIYSQRSEPWVDNNYVLSRIASISASDTTAKARLQTWGSAWQGFIRQPILGYGQENFYLVFNQYFNPDIYRHANSRLWYDRAHNIFIDHLLTGGIIGLGLYLWFGFYTLVVTAQAWSRRRKETKQLTADSLSDQMIFLALFAFFVQGIFVFESLVTYIPLIVIVAYTAFRYSRKVLWQMPSRIGWVLFITYLIALFPIMYFVNIRETQANLAAIEGISHPSSIEYAYNQYVRAIDYGTSGTQEYRRRLGEFVDGLIVNHQITPAQAKIYVARVDQELEKRIVESPKDVANYLMYMRHLNTTYVLDYRRLLKVDELAQKALEYSPTRPQIYYEMGYAQFYLSEQYRAQKDTAKELAAMTTMIEDFQKSIDLNPAVKESYVNAIMVLLASGKAEDTRPYLNAMNDRNINYTDKDTVYRILNSAVAGKQYVWLAGFYQDLIAQDDKIPDFYIGAALASANAKQYDQAIAWAEKAKVFGGDIAAQSEKFIQCVKSKNYVTEPSFSCK